MVEEETREQIEEIVNNNAVEPIKEEPVEEEIEEEIEEELKYIYIYIYEGC